MSQKSDLRGGASEVAAEQALRLRRLRALVTHYQVDAAEAAAVSQDAWSRMEVGTSRIDPVALARFCIAYGLPAGYVITGALHGFADEMLGLVALAEASGEEPPRVRRSRVYAPPPVQPDMEAQTPPKPSRRIRRARKPRKAPKEVELELAPLVISPDVTE